VLTNVGTERDPLKNSPVFENELRLPVGHAAASISVTTHRYKVKTPWRCKIGSQKQTLPLEAHSGWNSVHVLFTLVVAPVTYPSQKSRC